jgi:NTP pyrophosphatase (non-canonical NTP hydrolase)/nucleoside 2-deoxyribosyltransferase
MTTAEFEEHVTTKSSFDMDLNYAIIGICGEAGECAEWYKKAILRKQPDSVEEGLLTELGDVLYYVTRAALLQGWTLEQVMAANQEKLERKRKERMAKKVYVASAWVTGNRAVEVKKQLEAAGIEVTSRWLERVDKPDDASYDYSKDADYMNNHARLESEKDIEDVRRADAVVVVNLAKSEGKAVETGMAIAWGIPVIVIGEKTNTFHSLSSPAMKVVATVEEALEVLRG